ncbi:MAG: DUF4442 domain-containing protein [Actinomycetota bacterium]|nr:DUF4442 domain-containing protein [Actinomycetota bacterium]
MKSRRHFTPAKLTRMLNFWPPMLGAGIRVQEIEHDWTRARVKLVLNRLNRNQHGTAFGGSIGAMTDVFFALLLMRQLGQDYTVWDQAVHLEYVSRGAGTVYGVFEMPLEVADQIRTKCDAGQKVLHWFEVDLRLADGTVVARARRQIYARKKRAAMDRDALPAAGSL